MRHLPSLTKAAILCTIAALSLTAWAVRVGDSAPDFTGTDSNGQSHKLSEYRGKYVVLEWTNNGCPYTRKHYTSGNMQSLQKEWTAKGVVWLTVLSSAPGAQTTPDMYVIDPSGKLIYSGAIDDHPNDDPSDIPHSKNYVSEALTEAMAGQQVAVAYTRPYGCSVKYQGD